MQFVMEWQQPGQFRFITFSESVRGLLLPYVQDSYEKPEAGGLLIGYRRGPHIEVVLATSPMARDIRRRGYFFRKDPGHQKAAHTAWSQSEGLLDHVGEWHTHPEPHPTPSLLDRMEWARLSLRRRKTPMLGLILGTSTCSLYRLNGLSIEKLLSIA